MSVVLTKREANVCGNDQEGGQSLQYGPRGKHMSVVMTQRDPSVCDIDPEGGQYLRY